MYKCYVCETDLPGMIRPFHPVQLIGCDRCMEVSTVTWLDDIPTVVPLPDYSQLRMYVPEDSVLAKILASVPSALTLLPVLEEIPQRIVQTIHKQDSSLNDVAQVIREDGVLTTKVLSLSNSAFFATVSEIVDLPTACSRLGMRTLGNIANAMAFANQYKSKDRNAIALMQKLWVHSLATAHCAELLADRFGIDKDTAYVAGLLHDIGQVVLIDIITTKFGGTPQRLRESADLIVKAIEPVSHLVGLHVLQYWKLSGELTHPVFFLKEPEKAPTQVGKELAYCVGLASDMADQRGYGVSDPSSIDFEGHEALMFFKLPVEELDVLSAEADALLNSVMTVFSVPV